MLLQPLNSRWLYHGRLKFIRTPSILFKMLIQGRVSTEHPDNFALSCPAVRRIAKVSVAQFILLWHSSWVTRDENRRRGKCVGVSGCRTTSSWANVARRLQSWLRTTTFHVRYPYSFARSVFCSPVNSARLI